MAGFTRPQMPSDNRPAKPHFPDNQLDALLDDDDETLENLNHSQYLANRDMDTLAKIEDKARYIRNKYPNGGLKSSRIIDTEILLSAPADFFDKYIPYVKEVLPRVQNEIADTRSEIVNQAQLDPTNEDKQNQAYYTVSAIANAMTHNIPLRGIEKDILHLLICNEIIGMSRIEPLWCDQNVTEIICNGPNDIQIEVAGQLYRVPSCKFDSQAHLMRLLERLFRSVGKVLSQNSPRIKGRLHDKSRLHAVHPSIAPDGPNFNIRRHPEGFWTPQSILRRGTANEELLTYIGNLIHKGCSALVYGGTGSGKTSLMNALTGFYPDNHRIVSLEDNLEMKINPRKSAAAPMECRPEAPDQPGSGVTMRDLVQASTQMRPDIIVVGETTDGAAYDLCQALNTGHYGMSTVHANNPQAAITRLCSLVTQSGMTNLENAQSIVKEAFDIIIEVARLSDGSRKIVSVSEVGTDSIVSNGKPILPIKTLWKYIEDSKDENGKISGHWEQVSELSEERRSMRMLDLKNDLTWDELKSLSTLPEGAKEE